MRGGLRVVGKVPGGGFSVSKGARYNEMMKTLLYHMITALTYIIAYHYHIQDLAGPNSQRKMFYVSKKKKKRQHKWHN